MRDFKITSSGIRKTKMMKRKRVLDYKKITMLTMRFLIRLDFRRLPGPIIEPVFSFSCGKTGREKVDKHF